MGTEVYLSRLEREIESMESIEAKKKKINKKLESQLKELEKSNQMFESKIKLYEETLKDGSTLSKKNKDLGRGIKIKENDQSFMSLCPTRYPEDMENSQWTQTYKN